MKVAVVGAGPAGLMSASTAAENGCKVTLFERNEKVGKKLYITGKGRCNLTNICTPKEFLENVVSNPKFLYGSICSFTPNDTMQMFEEHGVKLKVERGNRVFPLSDKASDITKALVQKCEIAGVEIQRNNVIEITRNNNKFCLHFENGVNQIFDSVILACGGMSYPTTGSNGDGYKLATKLGHTLTKPVPALVPIILHNDITILQGLTLKNVNVKLCVNGKTFERFGEMLFTSNGVSGPIILSLSSYVNRLDLSNATLSIDIKPALTHKELDKRILSDFSKIKNKQFKNSLDELLPKSLIPYIIRNSGINSEKPVNAITRSERETIVDLLKNLTFNVSSLAPIELGIVTAGGISVSEVNPKTMESKLIKGLYFAGEMLDVDALTGGYNIQIALSTGYVAGLSVGVKKYD